MPTYENTSGVGRHGRGTAGQLVYIEHGETIQTYQILGDGWTKTSDEPYYAIGRTSTVTVSTTGSATGLLGSKYLELRAQADGITVTANSASNPNSYPLKSGESFWIDNSAGIIDELHFSGGGDVIVVELDQ